ncbi:MAG: antibiotic biosynthesis monooxygenase [Mycobacteriaceae bacterium]|nr:antibiotic biosynthesis monooxygenase [Mycobacteriaceae bacterium]
MTESIIGADSPVVTLINVFTVDPANQQRLVELWQPATDEVMRHLPGFVSANVHRSLDGTKVVNYAQWESQDAFRRRLRWSRSPARRPRVRPARGRGRCRRAARVRRSLTASGSRPALPSAPARRDP